MWADFVRIYFIVIRKLKKITLRKKSKQKISVIQRLLWNECKRIIRKKYGNICYTCGRTNLNGSNWQTGHLWSKASLSAYLKYDLRVLRPQCYNCNINRGGMGADFYLKMWETEGVSYMRKLEADRKKTVKAYDFYLGLLEKYKKK